MASLTSVGNNVDTSGSAYATSSLSWTSGSYGFLLVWFDTDPGTVTITGWTQIGSTYNAWSGADDVYMLAFVSNSSTLSTGTITISPANSFSQSVWYAVEAASAAGTTGTLTTAEGESASHTSADVGTLGTGDVALLFNWSTASDAFSAQAGTTILAQRNDTSVQRTAVSHSTTDDTPGLNGALNQFGTIAFIVDNAAAASGIEVLRRRISGE